MVEVSKAWKFEHQVIDPIVYRADEVVCGDIDGDGRIDILCSFKDSYWVWSCSELQSTMNSILDEQVGMPYN